MRIHLDTSTPIVAIKFPTSYTDADVRELVVKLDEHLQLGRRHGYLTDLRSAQPLTSTQRKMISDWIEARRLEAAALVAGNAVILDSAVLRGVLTAITWVVRPSTEVATFAEPVAARAWLHGRLGMRGAA